MGGLSVSELPYLYGTLGGDTFYLPSPFGNSGGG